MAAFEQKFSLGVPSSTQNLALIREFVANVGLQAGLSEPEVVRLELAVDEACANVIEHAHRGDATKDVTIRATFDAAALQIDVIDTGSGFDPTRLPPPDLETLVAQRKSGGLGFHVMRTLMDEVSYEILPGQSNRLRMVKRLAR